MLLQPILYVLVFLICVAVFARARSRAVRQWVLFAGSCALYLTWRPWFAAILIVSTVMNYLLGKWLQRKPSAGVLTVGVLFNLALLATFKYLPEAAVSMPFSSLQRFSHLVLPLGISFWTFQAMSYLFDLYRGEELDPSPVEFALYMAFFPVVVSGPVCRMPDMLPQFRSTEITRGSSIGRGLARIATGVLMMQLAQLLGQGILSGDGINSGFDRLAQWSGPDVWCLALGYGLQLFFDFAGYSHIAIGAAQSLGFVVPENFARPFASTSPSIFWTRWHMSLSFWIRDYVFLPLAMMRREQWWRTLALVASMLLFGLWHKATVLFALWGAYHGILLVLHRQLQQVRRYFEDKHGWKTSSPPEALLAWAATTGLISLGWIFFRAGSLAQARKMLLAVVSPASYFSHDLSGSLYALVAGLAAAYALVVPVASVLERYNDDAQPVAAGRGSAVMAFAARNRWFWIPPLYTVALLLTLAVTHTRGLDAAQFMYRNF